MTQVVWQTALTSADIADINQYVRDNPPTAAQKLEIANLTGRTIRTVQRWFSSSEQQYPLIRTDAVGVCPARGQEDVSSEMNNRILAAIVLTGGPVGGIFHGTEREIPGTFGNEDQDALTEVIEKLHDVQTDPFYTQAMTAFEVTPTENGFFYKFKYRECANGESPLLLQSFPVADQDIVTEETAP